MAFKKTTPVVKESKPAKKTTPVVKPAKKTTPVVKPAKKTTPVVTKKTTPVVKPAKKTTPVVKESKPAKKTTPVVKESKPAKKTTKAIDPPPIPPSKRKVVRKVTLAGGKIPPPKGWSESCWNLFQDKRSRTGEKEFLDIMAVYCTKTSKGYKRDLSKTIVTDLITDDQFRVCCSERDKDQLKIVVSWLTKYEK